ncbi:MAG: hypothetical protein ACRC0X_05005 [Brevinema sp.]
MIYENHLQNTTDTVKTISKQEIFQQIDEDILSHKQNNSTILQQTKSNYKFVILLDFIALVIACTGAFIVYNIFKEQQIRLVSGQKGVRVLESSLLEEINKQYARDLAVKEQELQDARRRLAEIESEYGAKLEQINREAQQELERQKLLIEQEIAAQLVGKNDIERQEIQRQYAERLKDIENSIARERLAKEALEREQYQQIQIQEEQNINQEQLRLQLEEAQQRLQTSQMQLTQIQNVQLAEQTQRYNDIEMIRQFDQSITALFLTAHDSITNGRYNQVKNSLDRIQVLYRNTPETFSQQRKDADLYIVEMLLNYMDSSEQLISLQQINIDQRDLLMSLGQQNGEVSVKQEELRYFISTLTNKDQNILAHEQIRDFDRNIPELLSFAEYYITFSRQDPELELIIQQADDLVDNKMYQDAINTYQQIFQNYSVNDRAQEIVQKFYNTILLELHSQNIFANNPIPQTFGNDIQQLLSSSRYGEITHQIVYLKEPDGYIADIVDQDTVLVVLLPQKKLNPKQNLEVYRVLNQGTVRMDQIGILSSQKQEQRTFSMTLQNHYMKLGDLVYIK